MTSPQDLKTIGLPPFSFHASDLLHVAKLLASDAAMVRDTDRHACASHFFAGYEQGGHRCVVKVLESPMNNRNQ
jgi:hypothetical protein